MLGSTPVDRFLVNTLKPETRPQPALPLNRMHDKIPLVRRITGETMKRLELLFRGQRGAETPAGVVFPANQLPHYVTKGIVAFLTDCHPHLDQSGDEGNAKYDGYFIGPVVIPAGWKFKTLTTCEVVLPNRSIAGSQPAPKELAHEYWVECGPQLAQQLHLSRCASVKQRLATFLLDACHLYPDGVIRITQPHIANAIGTRRDWLGTSIGELQYAGLVDTRYGKMLVKDTATLRRIANGEEVELPATDKW